MGTTPFTLENHSTAGCNKFSSPRQILPNWIRCVIAVLWLSKMYGHNSIHHRKSQYSWRQQILITEINSSKLDTMCNSCYYNGSRKCMGTTPCIHLRKSQYNRLQEILITETNSSKLDTICNSCIMALESACMGTTPFTFENHSTAGCNKFSYETNSSKLDMMCNSTADCNKLSSLRPVYG